MPKTESALPVIPTAPPRAARRLAVAVALSLVVLAGAWLRLDGLNWDANQHLHPDERFLAMVMTAERWPASLREYFDESVSPLNPRNVGFAFFAYGTLPTTIIKGVSLALGMDDYHRVTLVGRVASAIVDLGSILLSFMIARRLYRDARIGILAALLLATAVLAIQHSHFFVVDTFATFFVTASIWALTGDRARIGLCWVLSGVLFGLALACKFSVVGFAVVITAVGVCGLQREWGVLPSSSERRQAVIAMATRLCLAGLATLVAFRLAQPDAFRGAAWYDLALSDRWVANLLEASRLMSGNVDFPPGIQWAFRVPYWFAWKNLVLWGMGPAMGLAAWAGWGVAGWRLVRRSQSAHLIPVLWTAILFLHQGGQFVMAGRYLLPIYPMLALLAAWALVTAWDTARRTVRARRVWIVGAGAIVGTVVLVTALWAVAFTHVYRVPNSRIAASRWIEAHVPAGAILASEHWDDRLPLWVANGRSPALGAPIELTLYDDDTPEKLETLIGKLERADYVVLSSNRLYDSITRMPMRYPMTIRYYRALFSGELGFERVVEFTSYPRLGTLQIPDQSAEEAFSVYDHARVQVFRKAAAWDASRARAMLGNVDWASVAKVLPGRAQAFHNGLMLTPDERAAARAGGTWSRIFNPSGATNMLPVPVWMLALEILGLLAFPLTACAARSLDDRGWMISKSVGLLLVGYGAWMLASLRMLPFGRPAILGVAAVLAAGSVAIVTRQRAAFGVFWREHRALILKEEAIFWSCFLGFLAIRAMNPDLWHGTFGGEKPMDYAYLNATVRSEAFPPYDPWFSGGYINYYYFGFVLVASLIKLTGIVPQVAYNLAIPTFFALSAAGACAAATAVTSRLSAACASPGGRPHRWRPGPLSYGVVAAVFAVVIGNLVELGTAAQVLVSGGRVQYPPWYWYWNATRAIAHTATEPPPITEFPFFTFLYGDLHAHMMALPYTLLVLVLSVVLVSSSKERNWSAPGLATLGLLALTMGALYVTNTWDYPTYLVIVAAALAIRAWMHRQSGERPALVALEALAQTVIVVAAGRLLFFPFFLHYTQAYGVVTWWTGSRTSIGAYVSIHGLFLFIVASLIVCGWRVPRNAAAAERERPVLLLVGSWIAMAALLTVAVEWIAMEHDTGRMNTVFKFYFQAWVLFSVSSACALSALVPRWVDQEPAVSAGWRGRRLGLAWGVVLVVLVTGSALYPLLATPARWKDRFDPSIGMTLDGQAYMTTAVHTEQETPFELRWDLQAIRWLQTHIDGTPVVLEAHAREYRWGSRVSSNTGLPTVLGWSWHQTQQRAATESAMIRQREQDIERIYSDASPEHVLPLLKRYHVEFVYVGPLERILYPAAGLAKFSAATDAWRPVYENAEVRIYRINDASTRR